MKRERPARAPRALIAGALGLLLAGAVPWVLAAGPESSADGAGFDARAAGKLVHGLLVGSRYDMFSRDVREAELEATLDHYLADLDPDRLLFTEADVETYRGQGKALRAAVTDGEFDLPRAIFEHARTLAMAREAFVRARLAEPDGLRAQGAWLLDRSRAPRPRDAAERDALWRQALADDALDYLVPGLADAQVREALATASRVRGERLSTITGADVDANFIDAFVKAMDPDGEFMSPPELEPRSTSSTSVSVGLEFVYRDGFVVIHGLVPGGSAAESGEIAVGDRILAIATDGDGPMRPVLGLGTEETVARTRGEDGTTLRLQLLPANARVGAPAREVRLQRRPTRMGVGGVQASVIEVGGRKVGVLDLESFYRDFEALRRRDPDAVSAGRDLARELARFRSAGVDAVLLDLRGNSGGALQEGVDVAGLFLGRGPVLQVRVSDGPSHVESATAAAPAWSGPLAVLVDDRSAAASEIVAAAISDRGRGLVLGERTFGRNTIQMLHDLDRWPGGTPPRLGMVKLTIAMVHRVDGRLLDGEGVIPDIELLPSIAAPRLPARLPSFVATPLPPAPIALHPQAGALAELVPVLREAHAARLAATPAYREAQAARRSIPRPDHRPLDLAERRAGMVATTVDDGALELRLAAEVLADLATRLAASPNPR